MCKPEDGFRAAADKWRGWPGIFAAQVEACGKTKRPGKPDLSNPIHCASTSVVTTNGSSIPSRLHSGFEIIRAALWHSSSLKQVNGSLNGSSACNETARLPVCLAIFAGNAVELYMGSRSGQFKTIAGGPISDGHLKARGELRRREPKLIRQPAAGQLQPCRNGGPLPARRKASGRPEAGRGLRAQQRRCERKRPHHRRQER